MRPTMWTILSEENAMSRIASTLAVGLAVAFALWVAWLLYAVISASLFAPTHFFM
jgi:hypothetical protein